MLTGMCHKVPNQTQEWVLIKHLSAISRNKNSNIWISSVQHMRYSIILCSCSKTSLIASKNHRQFFNLKGVLSSMEKKKRKKNYFLNLVMIDKFLDWKLVGGWRLEITLSNSEQYLYVGQLLDYRTLLGESKVIANNLRKKVTVQRAERPAVNSK